MSLKHTGPELAAREVSLADPSVIPSVVRIEYGAGSVSHLSVIVQDGEGEKRARLSIAREDRGSTTFSNVQNEIARNVPEEVAHALVKTVNEHLKLLGRETKETTINTKHGKLLVFRVVKTDAEETGAEVFERMDTKNARTPVVASKP